MPILLLLAGLTARQIAGRALLAAATAGGIYVIGRTAYELGESATTTAKAVESVIPLATYATAGIVVYNIARRSR